MAKMSPIEVARFWSRVSSGRDFHCWEWQGAKAPKGYGRCSAGMAHRVAYELVYGPIPEGLVIRHKCDNPRCCNPKHLTPGTTQDNTNDKVERGRHPRGQSASRAKLTEDEALEILRNPDRLRVSDLAQRFNVSKSTVSLIRSGDRWAHLAK